VEKEIDHIINEEARNFGDDLKGLENYLEKAGKTIEQHRDDLKPAASDRVKAYLVTGKIAELENITVSDEELEQLIENMAKDEPDRAENIRQLFALQQPRESLRDMKVINKTMDYLTGLATGQE
jgi:trigger factor